MKRFPVCLILFGLVVAFLCGCEMPDELNSFDWPWEHHHSSGDAAAAETPAQTAQGETPTATTAAAKLIWRYGGFNGSGAVEDPANVIRDLHIVGDRLSFGWSSGDLSNWGVGRTDATAIAAAFFWSDEERAWVGGKFEWVDFSRTTRHLGNLDGYGGWRKELFYAAKRRAFCIARKDGRARTNLLVTEEP